MLVKGSPHNKSIRTLLISKKCSRVHCTMHVHLIDVPKESWDKPLSENWQAFPPLLQTMSRAFRQCTNSVPCLMVCYLIILFILPYIVLLGKRLFKKDKLILTRIRVGYIFVVCNFNLLFNCVSYNKLDNLGFWGLTDVSSMLTTVFWHMLKPRK